MSYEVSDFEREVIQRSYQIPVLVDFWASWCGPCRILGPILERLATENNDNWVLAKVDTEELTDIAQRFQVQSIPNVKLFVDGKVIDEFVGALPEHAVRRWLERAIPSKHRKQIQEAEQLLQAGKKAEAQRLLEQVLELESGNVPARIMLAQLVLFQNPPEAALLLENVDDPHYSEAAEAVRTIARLREIIQKPSALPPSPVQQLYLDAGRDLFAQDFDAALREFIEVIRLDRYYDNDGSRKACIAIFKILGEEHETTVKYRRDFSSALYV